MAVQYLVAVIISISVSELSLGPSAGHAVGHATEEDFLHLHKRLLKNYSRHVRPLANQSAALEVSLDFSLMSIFDVDDVKQQISVMAMVTVQWKDKNLVWNASDYGGINRMFFKQQQIWSPEVYVASGDNSVFLFTLPTQHSVRSDGRVTFTSVGNVQSPCSLDLTCFPYDRQTCKFDFSVLDWTLNEINLTLGLKGVTKSTSLVENGEWAVDGTDSDISFRGDGDEVLQSVEAIVKIKRRSTYYIINILVPAIAIAILSLLTFGVPVESGERLAYALTILLSLSVYITYIGSIMPMYSVNMPIIFYLLLGLFMMCSMCVVMTVLVIALRWSHVVCVSDNDKTISVFGVRFKIKRALGGNDLALKCCSSRFRNGKKTSALSPERKLTSGPGRPELWELENSKFYTIDRQESDPGSQRAFSFRIAPDDFSGIRNKTSADETSHLPAIENRETGDFTDKSDGNHHDQTTDPDILFICNQLNLYSFLVLVLSFVILLSFIFVQLHHQLLPE